MKSIVGYIFLALLVAFMPSTVFSQELEHEIHTEPVLLADALDVLSARFNQGFIYRSEVVANKQVVLGEGATLEEVLADILVQHSLIAIRIGESSLVVLPYEDKDSFGGTSYIGGDPKSRLASLEGQVRSTAGDPLKGAQVFIHELGRGNVASNEGWFEIGDLEPGTYKVTVSFIGYRSVDAFVVLGAGKEVVLDMELQRDVLQLDGIITTATRTARLTRESVVSLSVLNSHDLSRMAPASQADILRGVPGVHTEGGGGEVHANVFLRGLPAPGQYKYSTLQEDGMPLITESSITSSAIDAFFRYDLGVERLEFVRGGSSSLYGVGTPVGIMNYISKTGGARQETQIQTSVGQQNLYRLDLNSGGPLGERGRYNVSGFYRYDEGPIFTGLPSEGLQVKGNVTRIFDNGYLRVHGKYINDRVQFFLPFPHAGITGKPATGVDGEPITTLNASQAANFTFQTPSGLFESALEEGISTQGPTLMIEIAKEMENGVRLEHKTRWTDQKSSAHLFLPFPAFQPIDEYASRFITNPDTERAQYVYTDTAESYEGEYVVDQGAFHWDRPVKDISTKFLLTKSLIAKGVQHKLNAGVLLARTSARQQDTEPWILTEFANRPRLVDLVIERAGPDRLWGTEDDSRVAVTQNGLSSAARNYTNIQVWSNRVALFAGDEMVILDRLRLDIGLRYEIRHVRFNAEQPQVVGEDGEFGDALAVQGFLWGNGRFSERTVRSEDVAASIGLNYTLSPTVNLYGVASRSHFFPQVAALTNSTELGNLDNERFIQLETGVKYGVGHLASTLAIYIAQLDDRFDVDIRADEEGGVRNRTIKIGGSRTVGVEWTWGYIPRGMEFLHMYGNMTYQAHRYRNFVNRDINFSGNQIERQPRFMFSGGVSFGRSPLLVGIQAKYTGARFASADNIHRLDGYTLVQLDGEYVLGVGEGQSIRFSVHVFNVFNSRGLTEGDPRLLPGTRIEDQLFFNARPVLGRRSTIRFTYQF